MKERLIYLEKLAQDIPKETIDIQQSKFEKYSRYMGNGIYSWQGMYSSDTRELFLLVLLKLEGINYKQI